MSRSGRIREQAVLVVEEDLNEFDLHGQMTETANLVSADSSEYLLTVDWGGTNYEPVTRCWALKDHLLHTDRKQVIENLNDCNRRNVSQHKV